MTLSKDSDASRDIIASLEKHGFNKVRKGLVSVAIEKALLDIGNGPYDKVVEELHKRYNCYLTDCYEHPEYLKQILEELFGSSHKVIIYAIQKTLKEFSGQEQIARFLQLISK